ANDVDRITAKIRRATGEKPRVWVWPYGAASGGALKIVQDKGYEMILTLDDGLATVSDMTNTPRVLISNDPDLRKFAGASLGMEKALTMRVVHVDLDYVYDEDAEQMDRNLGTLVQRIADMQVTTVFLQAFADPKGDGLVESLYFP